MGIYNAYLGILINKYFGFAYKAVVQIEICGYMGMPIFKHGHIYK